FAHDSALHSLTFTPDSKLLLVGSDRLTPVLDSATAKATATLPVTGVLAASADANLLVASAPDHNRVIWDVAAARARAVLPVASAIEGAAFSRDAKTLATWTGFAATTIDTSVPLWDLATLRVRLTLRALASTPFNAGRIRCVAFSPDGKAVAIGRQFGW